MEIVTHTDTDGVISAVIALQKIKTKNIYFSSPFLLRYTLSEIMKTTDFKELYIFDISPSGIAVKLATLFDKVVWIDHHETELDSYPNNFDVVIKKSPSAARLVAEYFDVDTPLVEIADEVDTNQVKSEQAAWIRDYIAALKFNFKGQVLGKALKNLVFMLSKEGIDGLMANETVSLLVKNYREWLGSQKKKIKEYLTVEEIKGKKIALVRLPVGLPTYAVVEELAKLDDAPFDLIVSATEKNGFVHMEFRTHTGFKVLDLARRFGGGGHEVAAGATIRSGIDLAAEIRDFFGCE